ncbi:PEGA domain-containing protein [Litorivivens sp.]|uniref:PEGA domain-containing protein n=1 Tax=Litorivivens sp. TaxID=2020868 RepID=UPI003568C95A
MDNNKPHSIKPATFQPPTEPVGRQRRPLRPLLIGAVMLLMALLFGLWFVLTATAIKIQTEPQAEHLQVKGGLVLPLGGNFLLRPGAYTVHASTPGYHDLEAPLQVVAEGETLFQFSLEKLPGYLTVSSSPPEAQVILQDTSHGYTPLNALELNAGSYSYLIRAPRYQEATGQVEIEGLGRQQRLHVALDPLWADVTLQSVPSGATLTVDGEPVGQTSDSGITAEIMPGKHVLGLSLPGYEDWAYSIITEANTAQTLPPVKLQRRYATLNVTSKPAGARVMVNGEYQGLSPLAVELRPDVPAEITLSKAGYANTVRTVSVASGAEESLSATMQPVVGEVLVRTVPADALLYIDGILRGRANQTVQLTATAHRFEIKKSGYATVTRTVTPRGGYQQQLDVRLLTDREAYLARFPETVETSTGDKLIRIEPGSFSMGSQRRAQGRQANEVQRDIKLTRMYYLATTEVTNAAFRQFRAEHSSGIVQRTTLDNDNYPVARVSWDDAIAFCNWLSKRDGLPEAYRNGKLITPVNTGYRLPTEAEWVWAARYSAGREERQYAWGNTMPPTGRAGNYADISAQGVVDKTLSSYNDGYVAAAPVGKFDPNPTGLFDLGGNVSEWMNDHYSVEVSTSVETDPLGIGSGKLHTIRGASWRHGRITELRLVYRDSGAEGRDDVGFRLARFAEAAQ